MTGGLSGGRELLPALTRLYGIQSSYTSQYRRRVFASTGALLRALRALGAPVERLADVPEAYRLRRSELWSRMVEPVIVAWDGRMPQLEVCLPEGVADAPIRVGAELEDGTAIGFPGSPRGPGAVVERTEVEGRPCVRLAMDPPGRLPFGYHTLRVEAGRREATSMVISAPLRARQERDRTWGVFLPLYALRSDRSWGLGDLTDLENLTEWVAGLGGSLVATLPLLATFLDESPFQPSPYSPASRLFWNELYLDPTRAPELERSNEARALLRSAALRREVRALRSAPLVDYRRAAAAKRQVLEALAVTAFSESSSRSQELRAFLRGNPAVADYARFRAAGVRHGAPWPEWPRWEREGRLSGDGGDCDAYRYHIYVQWLAAQQMEAAGRKAREAETGLYFDLPVGVSSESYDVWRERRAFVAGASAGAPPDAFFTGGQNWGFPPLHPDGIRDQGYRYLINSFRHVFRHAGVVRVDHVMGLHRMYVVPDGHDSGHGVYVRYQPEEIYAILTLESHRVGAAVVGEDLGTVPAPVRHAMARHGLHRSYVFYFELRPNRRRAVKPPSAQAMATLNTHDLPTFASFWRGDDLKMRLRQGWLGEREAERVGRERARIRDALVEFLQRRGLLQQERPGPRAVLRAVLSHLAASDAMMVLVNLEDLWLETEPQNVPGTAGEFANWRRPARYSFEEFRRRKDVIDTLGSVDRLRREKTKP